jgi:hypothetical protein
MLFGYAAFKAPASCQRRDNAVDALWDAIGIALNDFPPDECFNYLKNAGYGSG